MAICPSCGKENPDGFEFCGFCTAPLAEQPGSSVQEERKVVSVLFCDLVGFTAASEAADPEDVRARIRPYHARLRQEIERYGGTVEKFIGDAVMAVFGAPIAHEDDAERAVRAGLAVLEAIAELNEGDPGLELQVRVGINTGEAVVALGALSERGEGIVTGDVVNTAARIQGAAPVGGVAIGEQTYRATQRVFEYESLQPVSVKGKSEPLSLWQARVLRRASGSTSPAVHDAAGRAGVGEAASDRDVRAGGAAALGPAGHDRRRARGGQEPAGRRALRLSGNEAGVDPWRQGRCLPYGEGITFWALGEI